MYYYDDRIVFSTHTTQEAILQDWHVKLGVFFKSTKFRVILIYVIGCCSKALKYESFRDLEICWHFVGRSEF